MVNLSVACSDHIATVTLARPELRNAFNEQLITGLTDAFTDLANRDDIRVIVLAAQGKAFCAGADLNWMRRMADYSRDENLADAAGLAHMLHCIHTCPKPVIARVQGDAIAGGMGLVAACDIAIAVETASFCLSEVRLGLTPATISPYVMRAIGARATHRYALTAERFNAAQALRLGLVHETVAAPDNARQSPPLQDGQGRHESDNDLARAALEQALDARIADITAALVQASPNAVRHCKQLLLQIGGREINAELIADTVTSIADIRASEQGRQGVQAFLQKSRPDWLP